MGSSFGTLLRLTTFGESHGDFIGGVLDGNPTSNTNIHRKYNRNLIEEDPDNPRLVHREKKKTRFTSEVVYCNKIKHNLLFHWGHPLDFISRTKMHEAKRMQKSKIYIVQVMLIIRTMQSMELEIGVVVEDLLLEKQPAEL